MSNGLIWLHEDALNAFHPVFKAAPACANSVYIWDDDYLKHMNYSFKRLVFIYETLCELPVTIIQGNTLEFLCNNAETTMYIPVTPNPYINMIIQKLTAYKKIVMVESDPLVLVDTKKEFRRFFQYWKKAQSTAFVYNGGMNAKNDEEM
jgi:hypothetical protein